MLITKEKTLNLPADSITNFYEMELLVNSVTDTTDEINLIKQQNVEEVGGRKRTVSKSKSTTSNSSKQTVVWPEFKVQVPDPELGMISSSETIILS